MYTLKYGTVKVKVGDRVKSGPGLDFSVKKVSELTVDCKKDATSGNQYV